MSATSTFALSPRAGRRTPQWSRWLSGITAFALIVLGLNIVGSTSTPLAQAATSPTITKAQAVNGVPAADGTASNPIPVRPGDVLRYTINTSVPTPSPNAYDFLFVLDWSQSLDVGQGSMGTGNGTGMQYEKNFVLDTSQYLIGNGSTITGTYPNSRVGTIGANSVNNITGKPEDTYIQYDTNAGGAGFTQNYQADIASAYSTNYLFGNDDDTVFLNAGIDKVVGPGYAGDSTWTSAANPGYVSAYGGASGPSANGNATATPHPMIYRKDTSRVPVIVLVSDFQIASNNTAYWAWLKAEAQRYHRLVPDGILMAVRLDTDDNSERGYNTAAGDAAIQNNLIAQSGTAKWNYLRVPYGTSYTTASAQFQNMLTTLAPLATGTVTDAIPAGLTNARVVSTSDTGANAPTCSIVSNNLTCNYRDLTNGIVDARNYPVNHTVTIEATVPAGGGSFANTATVTTSGYTSNSNTTYAATSSTVTEQYLVNNSTTQVQPDATTSILYGQPFAKNGGPNGAPPMSISNGGKTYTYAGYSINGGAVVTTPWASVPSPLISSVTSDQTIRYYYSLAEFTVNKVIIAPADGIAKAGQPLTYQVTVHNSGTVPVDASFTDNLSVALGASTWGSVSATSGTPNFNSATKTLSWSQSQLGVNATATVTYTVNVANPLPAGASLKNAVVGGQCETGSTDPRCFKDPPTSGYTLAKSVTSSSGSTTQAKPGDVLTYQVKVTGHGTTTAPIAASFTDDLSGVLSNADYVANSATNGATVDTAAKSLSWSGSVLSGDTLTVTYQVTVKSPLANNSSLKNTLHGGQCVTGATNPVCGTDTPTAGFTVSKSVSPVGTVRAGDEVIYTVTVTHTGSSADPVAASFTDDLSGVLSSADYKVGSATSGATVDTAAKTLTWAGTVSATGSTTIEYRVIVKGAGEVTGSLGNKVTPGPGGACVPAGSCETTSKTSGFTVSKTVANVTTPGATVAHPGDTLEYTVTVKGTGTTTDPIPAGFSDDLSGVLNNAAYVTNSATNGATVDTTAKTLTWAGSVRSGETLTVTYKVTVKPAGQVNGSLHNKVTPGLGGECVTSSACETDSSTGGFTVSKSVDPTGPVLAGSTVVYTVTVKGTGTTADPIPASFTDDLSGVLTNADYVTGSATNGATVDTGAKTLSWSGTVGATDTVIVKYEVTVKDAAAVSGSLHNKVTAGPGGTCVPAGSCETDSPTAGYTVSKTVANITTPGATVAHPGDTLEYTVSVTGTGTTTQPISAMYTDDLSGVLVDATWGGVTSQPMGTTSADFTAETLTWTGSVASGDTVTVKYRVTIKSKLTSTDPLVNLVKGGDDSECDPATDATCEVTTYTSGYTLAKSAVVKDSHGVAKTLEGALVAGDTVTYTVDVTAVGSTLDPIPTGFTDDLSGVLSHATYVAGSATLGATFNAATQSISWSGSLVSGAVAHVSYTVTITSTVTSDTPVVNQVSPSVPGGSCDPAAACRVIIPTGGFTVSKAVVNQTHPGAAVAVPGDRLAYTVTVKASGSSTSPTTASFTDDLSGVLNNASYVAGSATNGATVDTAAKTLTWSGSVTPGTPVMVTYVVAVNPTLTGTQPLKNAVAAGPGGACEPGKVCDIDSPTSGFEIAKSASPTGAVMADSTVTYTVTVKGTGSTTDPIAAGFTDDLSGVLTNADYVANSATNGATVSGSTLTWAGTVRSGTSVTVSYQVKVKAASAVTGSLRNAVTPDPGGTCVPVSACSVDSPTAGSTSAKTVRNVTHPGATTARAGDTLEYTVTITGTGTTTGPIAASFTDTLTNVLANAAWSTPAGDPGLHGATFNAATKVLSWTGSVTSGTSTTIVYRVQVANPLANDATLTNGITPGQGVECDPLVDPDCQVVTPTEGFTVSKTASPTGAVKPGDQVTYTVTVTGTGSTKDPIAATFTDDLSGVVNNASMTSSTAELAAQGATYNAAAKSLSWAGTVTSGHTVTVTYVVTVNPSLTTNAALANGVTAGPGGSCDTSAGQTCDTTTDTNGYTLAKAVANQTNPGAPVARPGDTLEYTVTVTGTGSAAGAIPATFTDNLAGVLNNATLVAGSVSATSGTATPAGSTITWSGSIRPLQVVTVTYKVVVKPLTSNVALTNAVAAPNGSGGSCDPAVDVTCRTETPTGGFTVSKAAVAKDAGGNPIAPGGAVGPGATVTYTVTVAGTGSTTAPIPASFADDLSGVVGSAPLATSTSALAAQGAAYDAAAKTLTWNGTVMAGSTVTVVYDVVVGSAGVLSGGALVNRVAPTTPGGSCDPAAGQTCTTTTGTGGFTLTKSATAVDAAGHPVAAGTPVRPGATVTYTVHVAATGSDPVSASFRDDLSKVLNNATMVTVLPSNGLSLTGNILTWSGTVTPGTPVDVVYQVKVKPVLSSTDALVNVVTPVGDGTCVGTCTTTTGTSAYTVSKTATSSNTNPTVAAPGDTVTYTIHVAASGSADVAAEFTDDVSGITPYATLHLPAGLTQIGTTLHWAGTVRAGSFVDVTYTAVVGSSANLTQVGLTNSVAPGGPDGSCETPDGCETTTDTQGFTVAKSADKTTAKAGETVTYTVTVTNTGTVPTPASFTDDLTQVVDDAHLVLPLPTGMLLAPDGKSVHWSGNLAVGQTLEVVYQVRLDDPMLGDKTLINKVKADTDDGDCTNPDGCDTTTVTQGFTITKRAVSSNADSAIAKPGDTVTYTIHIVNANSDAVTPSFSDDLSEVLAAADIVTTTQQLADQGAALSGTTLNWASPAPLDPGASLDVTYTVVVKDPVPAGATLTNVVTPGAGGLCVPAGGCSTETTTQSFSLSKSADKATVKAGDTVTYTVAVVNTGTAAVTASFVDDLSAVLANATLVTPLAPGLSLDAATGHLTWTGDLAVGQTAPVTYTVTVDNPLKTNASLRNVVVPAPGSGGVCLAGECSTTTTTQGFTMSKTAHSTNPVVGAVEAGDTVTYTVHLVSTGSVAVAAKFTDDLSGVLGAADLAPLAPGSGLTLNAATQELTWNGTIEPGASVDVTYSVVAKDPLPKDAHLKNVVAAPPHSGGSCEDDNSCTTDTDTASFTVAKAVSTSNADPTIAAGGDTVTYTVTVTSTGTVAGPASFKDNLTDVLANATLVPLPAGSGLVYDAATKTLSWSGTVTPGSPVEVTYQVVVKSTLTTPVPLTNSVTAGPGGSCEDTNSCETTTDTTGFTLTKSASKTSGIKPGDTVTYTVHVVNVGSLPVQARFRDNLTDVVDDATLVESSVIAPAAYDPATARLTWTKLLAVGESVDVTYSVVVNNPMAGNKVLKNVVVAEGPGTCVGTCSTEGTTGTYLVKKTVSPTVAGPGERVTYTVHVINDGSESVDARFSDDLAGVLNAATLDESTLAAQGLTRSGDTLSWAGTVAGGETKDVTYAVVLDNPLPEDVSLTNLVTPDAPGRCAQPGDCQVTSPTRGLSITKTASPANQVAPGDKVTYTVTMTNTGTGAYTTTEPAILVDDMSDVFDDAVYNGDVTSTMDATTRAVLVGGQLHWAGPLAAGASVTITYSVTVKPAAELSTGLTLKNTAFRSTDPSCEVTGTCRVPTCTGPDCSTVTEHVLGAVDDAATTEVDRPVIVDVLANDVGTRPLTVEVTTPPHDCTAVVNPDGTITYTPAPGFSGVDEFTYTITDQWGDTSSAVVTITVTPKAVDDSFTGYADKPIRGNVVTGSQGRDQGTGLTVTGHTPPTHGQVTLDPDGTMVYTPEPNFSGDDSFTYTIADGAGTPGGRAATVQVTVRPVANNDQAVTRPGESVIVPVLDNDRGKLVPGTVVIVDPPKHGTATVNPDGTVTYTPNPGHTGDDSLTYTVTDETGHVTDPGTVHVSTGPLAVTKVPVNLNGVDELAPDPVGWLITLTNIGVDPIEIMGTPDDALAGVPGASFGWDDCTGDSGRTSKATEVTGIVLQPGEALACRAHSVASQADFDGGQQINSVTATGRLLLTDPANPGSYLPGPTVDGTGNATMGLNRNPSLGLKKTATVPNGAAAAKVGDKVTYTITASNNGNVTLEGVTISDPMTLQGKATSAWPTGVAGELLPGQSVTLTGWYEVTVADATAGHITNTATVLAETKPCVTDTSASGCSPDSRTPTEVNGPTASTTTKVDPVPVAPTGGSIQTGAGHFWFGWVGLVLVTGAALAATRRWAGLATLK